jgi:hypothetical protein
MARKTAVMGTSVVVEGMPPTAAVCGGYGPGILLIVHVCCCARYSCDHRDLTRVAVGRVWPRRGNYIVICATCHVVKYDGYGLVADETIVRLKTRNRCMKQFVGAFSYIPAEWCVAGWWAKRSNV